MATRTIVTLIDDLDGASEATETVAFSMDGTEFEIDLTANNAQQLRETLEPFVSCARRTAAGQKRRQTRSTTAGAATRTAKAKEVKQVNGSAAAATTTNDKRIELPPARLGYSRADRKAIQRFAEANGMPVPGDRGRIKRTVSDAWEEAGRPRGRR